LHLSGERPYFAEAPYYLWGQVNYDSDGDCSRPTDRDWRVLTLQNRETRETVGISERNGEWTVEGDGQAIARASLLLLHRCGWEPDGSLVAAAGDWDHDVAVKRAELVRREFQQPNLAPFDSHFFWGSWKWVGWFSTDCTWVGRMIMHSVVRNDPREIPLRIDWLREVRFPEQAVALAEALQRLSGDRPRAPQDWVRWYDGSFLRAGAKRRFPQPDIDAWMADLRAEFGG
jgi:hypothetical protein